MTSKSLKAKRLEWHSYATNDESLTLDMKDNLPMTNISMS